jgi:glycosyltransferase involved in cell wall biosynthesis
LTGIGRYTYKVSKELKRLDAFKLNYFYGYYSKNLMEPSSKNGIENIKSIISKSIFLKKVARKILIYSSRPLAPKCELYWQPNFIPNDGIKAKKVVTSVHDFSFIRDKNFHPKERIAYFEKYFFKNIYRSDMIITGSKYTKGEILEHTSFTADRIRVIYHGIDHDLFKVYQNVELDFDIPSKFILSVGSIEPRKNLQRFLKAYNSLPSAIKDKYKLVLVGFKGWENEEIMALIEEGKESIVYLGYITDEELAKVYALASLFVYPSLYEGFGLPVLEAMACGTPVVTSDVSSIPEVGGDAPLYCDPYSIDDIRDKMELVLSDNISIEKMIDRGLEQAKKFSWEKSAKEHMKLFEEVIKN